MNRIRSFFPIGVFLLLLIAIPLTMYLVRHPQIFKSRAHETSDIHFYRAGQEITETSEREVQLRLTYGTGSAPSPSPSPTPRINPVVDPRATPTLIPTPRPTSAPAPTQPPYIYPTAPPTPTTRPAATATPTPRPTPTPTPCLGFNASCSLDNPNACCSRSCVGNRTTAKCQ